MAGSEVTGQVRPPVSRDAALFASAFLDELYACGVRDVVVSPGSRSTPLAMVAWASEMRLFVDVDERGAAFFALGLAKASGRPVCLVCTSGTAVANYYPAVMEADASRVPLLVLTADRPPRLAGLGAPQTTDQLNAFGSHVRLFRQMPLPTSEPAGIALARQVAVEAWCAAAGEGAPGAPGCGEGAGACGCTGAAGPVQLNFPFDNPLTADLAAPGLFEVGRRALGGVPPVMRAGRELADAQADALLDAVLSHDVLVLAGEGSVACEREARDLLVLAASLGLPVVADVLSGLRAFDDPHVLDAYDEVFATPARPASERGELVVRFGRYPVSKACFTTVVAGEVGARPAQLVVDAVATRDFNVATDAFVRTEPAAFVRALTRAVARRGARPAEEQLRYLAAWRAADDAAAARLRERAERGGDAFEGAYVSRLLALAPAGSTLWVASSMSVRAADQFMRRDGKLLRVLCNRGLNGIDGTLSSALGACVTCAQTTLLTGDLALLHDLNALHLQRELLVNHGGDEAPSLVVVLLNNQGGGIFDLLPQASCPSEEGWFERLFLTPQQVDFSLATGAFGVPYRLAETLAEFEGAYRDLLGTPGVSLLEVRFPLEGTRERYRHV